MEKSHIVMHVITGLATGGAETMLLKLIRSSDNKRFPAVVVSLMDHGTLGQSITEFGVPVHALGMTPGRISFSRFLAFVRLIRYTNPALIMGWMYHANIAALCARTLARSSAKLLWNI